MAIRSRGIVPPASFSSLTHHHGIKQLARILSSGQNLQVPLTRPRSAGSALHWPALGASLIGIVAAAKHATALLYTHSRGCCVSPSEERVNGMDLGGWNG